MLQTAQLLPPPWLSTLGFDPARFQTEPPACYRASWQLPGPDSHRQATTSFPSGHDRWTSPPNALGARNFGRDRIVQAALKIVKSASKTGSSFVGVGADLPVGFAPDQPDRQPAA